MPPKPDELIQQILGQIQALEKLSAKEREQRPYSHFGQNYNKLLALAEEAMPTVDARRWPPKLPITAAAMGPSHVDARYVEIHGYFKEVAAILSEGIDFSGDATIG